MKSLAKRFTLTGAVFLAGCTTVPHDAGFADVETAVQQRIGQRAVWNRGTAADQAAERAVKELLAKELSIEGAIQVALLNNQSLQATYEDLGIAQAELVEAGLLHNPTLSAEVRFPSHARLPFEVDITQSFLDLFWMPLRKKAAAAGFEAAKAKVTHAVLDTAADVRQAYYRAQGTAQLAEMRQTIAQATEASADAARRLRAAGNITELALANEEALDAQAGIDLARAQREAMDAREELSALMGVAGEDLHWTILPHLPDLPTADPPTAHLLEQALQQREDLAAARQEVEVAAASLGLNRSAAWLSDLTVGGHFEQDADGTTTAGPTVSLPLPLFNQGQAAIAAAQARLRQSQRRYQAQRVAVLAQVRRALNSMQGAREIADRQQKTVLPLRHKIVTETQLHYNAMTVGVFQLLQVKQAEIDAGREYVEALQDYWIARSQLERAIGGRLELNPATTKPAATVPATMPMEHHHHEE